MEQNRQDNEAVKMLNAVIERRSAKDATFTAAWQSAKRLVANGGAPKGMS
jgi:hypothetical protein